MTATTLTLSADERTGFPLITLPGVGFEVGWLPLTWVQLEYFLAETTDRRFNAAWYQDLVRRTGRTSPAQAVGASDLPGLFVRCLTLQEALIIGRWWGSDRFVIPTVQEWQTLMQAAQTAPVDWQTLPTASTIAPRAARVLQGVENALKAAGGGNRKLAQQLLLDGGLRELALREAYQAAVVGVGKPGAAAEGTFGSALTVELDEGNRSRRTVGLRLFLKL